MWWYFLILLPVAIAVWLIYEWWEHSFIQYETTAVECQTLPQETTLRVCLISDLHNNRKNLKKVTERIRQFGPEMILLAGDLVDKRKAENLRAEEFLMALAKLQVPVFYSTGNHELSLSEKYPEAWKQYLKKLPEGVCFLDNESVLLKDGRSVCVSGLSLPREFYKKGKLYNRPEKLPDISVPKNKFHILLAHHPEYVNLYEKYGADFIVSGHLHGGLLRLPFIGGMVSPRLRLPDCDAGLLPLTGGSQLFVSRGLGSHTIPLRFFNRVEVNFLLLKGTENQNTERKVEP